jgi:DGQHR domain-containing protein
MILKLIKINQGAEGAIYAGKIAVDQLISSFKIDVFNQQTNPNGYQRELDEKRARKFATYLKEELAEGRQPTIPTGILLSYRKQITGTQTDYGIEAVFSDSDKLYVVDGQHRTNGFKIAIEDFGLNQLLKYELPVVIFENTKMVNEVKQFLLINNTMKKVRTDLARELMIKLNRSGGFEIPESEDDAIKATNITKMVNSIIGSPWKSQLSGPGDTKEANYLNTQLSFANSIKATVLKDAATKRMSAETAAKELVKYWAAWEKLIPEAFADSKKYLLTKNNGFVSLHTVFSFIYSHLKHVKGINEPTVEQYRKVIEEAGDAATADFWERENGDAGQFGGGYGGFKNLAEHIIGELSENGIEA